MKHIIIILLLGVPVLTATSQAYNYLPFVEKSSVWTEFRESYCGGGYWVKYFFGNDTTINDTVWTELYTSILVSNKDLMCNGYEGTYLDSYLSEDVVNKRVWQKDGNARVLFRDLSGSAGDTIFGKDSLSDWGPKFYEIITMDTVVEMNGLKMRKLNESFYEGMGYFGTFIRHYLLQECIDCEQVDMVCYERDGKVIYQNPSFSSCWPDDTTAISEIEDKYIVPSVLMGDVLVKTEGYDKLSLISVEGRVVLNEKLENASIFELKTEELDPNMYWLILSDKNGNGIRQKITVR